MNDIDTTVTERSDGMENTSPCTCSPHPFAGNWRCKCGWMITDVQWKSAMADFPCPRCGRKWSTFSQIKSVANKH